MVAFEGVLPAQDIVDVSAYVTELARSLIENHSNK